MPSQNTSAHIAGSLCKFALLCCISQICSYRCLQPFPRAPGILQDLLGFKASRTLTCKFTCQAPWNSSHTPLVKAAWNRSRTPLQARPQASPSAGVAPTVLDGTPDSERVRRCLEREAEDALPEVVRKDLAIQPDRPLVER